MSRKKVLVVLPMYHPCGEEILARELEVIRTDDISTENLQAKVQDVHAVVVRAPAKLTRSILESAKILEAVSGAGVGLDNIDVKAATELGIKVLHAPNLNSDAVAEHALALLLALSKKIFKADRETRQGNFRVRDGLRGIELLGKTIGILGLGAIGSAMAWKCRLGFGMEVLGYDPYIPKERADALGVKLVADLKELLPQCDFLSIHLPLTPQTKGLIGKEELALMKPTAVVVNTGRGGVIVEKDLIEILSQGKLAGAGIDVFEQEPPDSENPLLKMENVIVTPHMAGLSEEATYRMAASVAEGILAVLRGERPKNIANPEVLTKQ